MMAYRNRSALLLTPILALLAGCPSDDDPMTGGGTEADADTEADGPDTDADTDNDEPEPDTEGDEPEPETDGDEPGPDTDDEPEPLPTDCSCYDPAVDVELDFKDQCLERSAALPGCSEEAPPCDEIVEGEEESGGDGSVGPEEAVRCVVERLAAGETPPFVRTWDTFQGGDSTEYIPLGDGRYVTFLCGFFDNPPAYQSVRTVDVADGAYFTACIDDNPDDVQALFECMQAGLTDAADPMPACGG